MTMTLPSMFMLLSLDTIATDVRARRQDRRGSGGRPPAWSPSYQNGGGIGNRSDRNAALPPASLHRLDAELLGNGGNLGALPLARRGAIGRPPDAGGLALRGPLVGRPAVGPRPGAGDPRLDRRVGCHDGGDIRGDALAQRVRHLRWSEEPNQAVEREVGIPGLLARGTLRA